MVLHLFHLDTLGQILGYLYIVFFSPLVIFFLLQRLTLQHPPPVQHLHLSALCTGLSEQGGQIKETKSLFFPLTQELHYQAQENTSTFAHLHKASFQP